MTLQGRQRGLRRVRAQQPSVRLIDMSVGKVRVIQTSRLGVAQVGAAVEADELLGGTPGMATFKQGRNSGASTIAMGGVRTWTRWLLKERG
jgi:hypothetical protein